MKDIALLAALYAIIPPAIRDIGFTLPERKPRPRADSEQRLAAAQAKRERKANKLRNSK